MRNNVYGLDSDCVLRVVFYLKHIVLFDSIYAVLTIEFQQDRHVQCALHEMDKVRMYMC